MIQYEHGKKLERDYFEWMYHLVCNDRRYSKLSYRKLISYLHNVIFVPRMDMDDNRRLDGISFRYRFGFQCGYPDDEIQRYLDNKDCSVLEMMISLAFRVEEEIMGNYLYGNRTGQWFWVMIVSLGLGQMDDTKFDENYCNEVIHNFLERNYEPNGKGGLFTLEHPRRDMRDVDIWCQFMWYLTESEGE